MTHFRRLERWRGRRPAGGAAGDGADAPDPRAPAAPRPPGGGRRDVRRRGGSAASRAPARGWALRAGAAHAAAVPARRRAALPTPAHRRADALPGAASARPGGRGRSGRRETTRPGRLDAQLASDYTLRSPRARHRRSRFRPHPRTKRPRPTPRRSSACWCSRGERTIALELARVREIVPAPRLHPPAGRAAGGAGLVNLRGRVVTVVDLPPRPGGRLPPPPRPAGRLVLVRPRCARGGARSRRGRASWPGPQVPWRRSTPGVRRVVPRPSSPTAGGRSRTLLRAGRRRAAPARSSDEDPGRRTEP